MSSYCQLLYLIVFRTKNSMPSVNPEHVDQLFSYITGIIKNKNSHLYRISGTENHLHILGKVFSLDSIFSSFRADNRGGITRPRFAPGVIHIAPLTVVPLSSPFRVTNYVAGPGFMGCKGDLTVPTYQSNNINIAAQ